MRILTLQFSAKISTNYGQQAYICGNIAELGNWEPSKGLKLYTDTSMYPNWSSFRFIHVRQSTLLQFKLCILTFNGTIIRWQSIPLNGNRKIVASTNMLIFFQQNEQQIQISSIDPTPRISVRKKTLEILNDLDSDSSSSKEFWKDYMEDDQDGPVYFRNFVNAMRRIIQSQSQKQNQIRYNDQVTYPNLHCLCQGFQYLPQNYFIILSQNNKENQLNNQINEESKIFYLRDENSLQKAQKIKYLANAIISGKQYILVAHIYIKNQSLNRVQELLKLPLQWKTAIHVPKTMIKQCLKIIEFGVNMIVLEDQQSLKQVFSILNSQGYRPKMVKPLLYVLQLKQYKQTYIYCATCSHESFIQDLKINNQGKGKQKITKINQLLFMNPHFPTQGTLMRNLADDQKNIFKKIRYGKRIIVITVQNIKQISRKITSLLINIAGRKNHQIYIIQQNKLTGIQKYLPITNRDRIMVINSGGEIYASGQRTQTVYQTLILSPQRIQEMYDTIIKAVGADSHCKIRNTKKNTLYIEFTADQIGKCVKKFIIDSIMQMNLKSLTKLIIINKDQRNAIQIKPFCVSTDFYIKSIINGTFKIDNYNNNLLLCIDYSSQQKSLNLIEKVIKNLSNCIYQGFYCQKNNTYNSNFCRPIISQDNLITLLQTIIEESMNVPWIRSPKCNKLNRCLMISIYSYNSIIIFLSIQNKYLKFYLRREYFESQTKEEKKWKKKQIQSLLLNINNLQTINNRQTSLLTSKIFITEKLNKNQEIILFEICKDNKLSNYYFRLLTKQNQSNQQQGQELQ